MRALLLGAVLLIAMTPAKVAVGDGLAQRSDWHSDSDGTTIILGNEDCLLGKWTSTPWAPSTIPTPLLFLRSLRRHE
jgi:hypothetical protein